MTVLKAGVTYIVRISGIKDLQKLEYLGGSGDELIFNIIDSPEAYPIILNKRYFMYASKFIEVTPE